MQEAVGELTRFGPLLEVRLGQVLAPMIRGGHKHLGYVTPAVFCREELGISATAAWDSVRLGEGLLRRSILRQAFLEEGFPRTHVLELLRLGEAGDAEWAARAAGADPVTRIWEMGLEEGNPWRVWCDERLVDGEALDWEEDEDESLDAESPAEDPPPAADRVCEATPEYRCGPATSASEPRAAETQPSQAPPRAQTSGSDHKRSCRSRTALVHRLLRQGFSPTFRPPRSSCLPTGARGGFCTGGVVETAHHAYRTCFQGVLPNLLG